MAVTLRMHTGVGEVARSFSPAHDIGCFWPTLVAHALIRTLNGSLPGPIHAYLVATGKKPHQVVPALVSMVRACERMLDPAAAGDPAKALAAAGFNDHPPETQMAAWAQVGVASMGGWMSSALVTTEAGTLQQELAAVVAMGESIMDRYCIQHPDGVPGDTTHAADTGDAGRAGARPDGGDAHVP
jgi:hypothetical protein